MNKDETLLPVYVLIGTDKLKIKAVLDRLNQKMSKLGDMSVNTAQFDGETVNASQIINSARQTPFGSDARLCIVKNANKLHKSDSEAIQEYLENPCDTTVLILIYSKLARTTKIYKACEKISRTCIIDCSAPKRWKLSEKIISIVKSYGSTINLQAADKLLELVGEDTIHLDNEIKILLIANNNTEITLEQIESQVKKSAEIKPWDFTDCYAQRNMNKCLEMFSQMRDGSEYMLLPQICRIIRELICVIEMGPNVNNNMIAHELKYDAWRIKNHIAWSKNFTKDELVNALVLALDCDKKMKSTSNSALSFQNFLIDSLKTTQTAKAQANN